MAERFEQRSAMIRQDLNSFHQQLCRGREEESRDQSGGYCSAFVWVVITKLSQTGWLINSRHFFLTVLEAEKPKAMVLIDLATF